MVKATVCKTVIRRFESARRLHPSLHPDLAGSVDLPMRRSTDWTHDRHEGATARLEQGMRVLLLMLIGVLLASAGCAGGSAPQVQPGPSPPDACVDRFSGSIARTCR